MTTEKIQKFKDYFLRIQRDDAEINHFWFWHAGKMMNWSCLWFDTEEWAKCSRFTKVLNYLLIHVVIFLWLLVGVRVYQEFDELSPSRMAESLSAILGGFYAYLTFMRYALERDAMSNVIQVIDRKCLAVPRNSPRFQAQWEDTITTYKLEGKVMMAAVTMGITLALSQSTYALITGVLFYDQYIIISDKSYSLPWWIQFLHQSGVMLYTGYMGGLVNWVPLDILFQINRLFNVQANTIMELCLDPNYDPDQEYTKLRDALHEIMDLYAISEELKDFLKPYVFLLGTLTFILFASGGVAILIESKNGWFQAIAKSIAFPASCFLILCLWVWSAEHFTDGVKNAQDALFNCNWVDASHKIKHLILTYKTLLIEPNYIEAPPFVVLNAELLTNTLKNTYYFLAVLSDVLVH